ncbi:hypothetical protein PENTCL1PPCAC_5089, partial [Pristionchus entomophagus]
PEDIIRKVINYTVHANHSIVEMRKVCHLWKDLVDLEFLKISSLPTIAELVITSSADLFAGKGYFVMADFKFQKGNDFPYRVLIDHGFNVVEAVVEDEDPLKTSVEDDPMVTLRKHIRFSEAEKTGALSAITRIDRVAIRDIHGSRLCYLPSIFRNLRPRVVQFEELDMDDLYSESIIKVLRQWKVPRAHLTINNFVAKDISPRDFLLEVAGLVDTLHVQQHYNYANSEYQGKWFLFGVYESDMEHWMKILIDMFAKRVSKIKIEHNNYQVVAYEANAKHLLNTVSRLPGKRVWLEMNAFYAGRALLRYTLNEESNATMLNVNPRNALSMECSVALKHKTRNVNDELDERIIDAIKSLVRDHSPLTFNFA